jgi:hypothetical protein
LSEQSRMADTGITGTSSCPVMLACVLKDLPDGCEPAGCSPAFSMSVDDIENLPFDAHRSRRYGRVPAASLALAIHAIGFAQFPGIAPEDIAGIHAPPDANGVASLHAHVVIPAMDRDIEQAFNVYRKDTQHGFQSVSVSRWGQEIGGKGRTRFVIRAKTGLKRDYNENGTTQVRDVESYSGYVQRE